MNTTYSRHPELRLTAVDGEGVVLHLGSLTYFTVNETGLTILDALLKPRTLGELVTAVTDEYDVSDAEATTTVRDFIGRCVESKLLITEDR
ncbi:MAG: hypothetical protein JWM95_5115 [Gemmatimonadetes bacterium]|nr:hypothetical protein [Gemmatimonadota bacterium]